MDSRKLVIRVTLTKFPCLSKPGKRVLLHLLLFFRLTAPLPLPPVNGGGWGHRGSIPDWLFWPSQAASAPSSPDRGTPPSSAPRAWSPISRRSELHPSNAPPPSAALELRPPCAAPELGPERRLRSSTGRHPRACAPTWHGKIGRNGMGEAATSTSLGELGRRSLESC
jgi:hypothetical protein